MAPQSSRLERVLCKSDRPYSNKSQVDTIAHDFNNLLSIATCTLEAVKSYLPPADYALLMSNQSRMQNLVRALSELGKPPGPAKRLNPIITVQEVLAIVSENFSSACTIESTLASSQYIHADQDRVHHAVYNLALNAIQAMPDGGVLTLSTSDADVSGSEAPEGPYVRIGVEDTGIGMDDATLSRIFHPFQSTKGPTRGIGLCSVLQCAEDYGGFVSVSTALGEGTSIGLHFPVQDVRNSHVKEIQKPSD